jgi:hypothetical protein
MDDNEEIEGTPAKQGLEFHPPFSVYQMSVDGYLVPHVSGRVVDGMLHLMLDNRFGCVIPEASASEVVWFIANAMAVAAGYSCLGDNCRPLNPYAVKISRLSFNVKTVSEAEQ